MSVSFTLSGCVIIVNAATAVPQSMASRGIRIRHIPEDIQPELITCSEHQVEIVWTHDQHHSSYQAEWLRHHCYSEVERDRRRHRPIRWDARIAHNCPSADFNTVKADPAARLVMMQAVCDYGFCRICNVPTDPDRSNQMIELIGTRRQSHYGVYTLSDKTHIDNVGDTSTALDPHTDETYRLSHVGIIVFQVLQPSGRGGASTLVDGFEAVYRLRETYPADFDLLTRVPILCHRFDQASNSDRMPRWYMSRLPAIKLDELGEVCGVQINERQIAPLDLPGELIGPVYRALRRLFDFVYDEDLRLTFDLAAGEGLVFNNQRVLHGRTEFTRKGPRRSVLTASVDIEEFYSALRTLRASLGLNEPQMNYSPGLA